MIRFLSILGLISPLSFSPHQAGEAGVPVGIYDSEADKFDSQSASKYSFGISLTSQIYLPLITTPRENNWPMAAANPGRTSWTPEEVRGDLKPLWFRPFEAYILPRTQIIAAKGKLYISTSRGLYALDADTGEEKWVYPTDMPLGHSPTVHEGVVYVGGSDRKIHAIDAITGQGLWTFQAGAGFDTNPLVVEGKVFAGNRDGTFYAIYSEGDQAGTLAWKYETQGPILFSAAYKEGVVYFASDDSHAYALDAQTGQLVWKSAKLPGAGFHSWWPVVHEGYVIYAGSHNYRVGSEFGGSLDKLDLQDVYPSRENDSPGTFVGPTGQNPGDWVAGTPTIDTSKASITSNGGTTPVTQYFEQKPWRRTYLVLNGATGKEYTSYFDLDGVPEYAPILWFGAETGNRYPPIVGSDGVLYQTNNYMSDPTIAWGHVSGWQVGTPYISIITPGRNAIDEPVAYSGGGDLIYWNRCCDRVSGAFDISVPDGTQENRSWTYFNYTLADLIPGYNLMYYNPTKKVTSPYASFGGRNGVYGYHGDTNPPIPYRGKVYMHRSNTVIAFAPQAGDPVGLPTVQVTPAPEVFPSADPELLKSRLAGEVQKILQAGHLRPGYLNTGIFDLRAEYSCGDDLVDYWHHPADTIYTLIRALPYLPSDLQQQIKAYLQSEFTAFPPYEVNHIGWKDGAAREGYDLPPEVAAEMTNRPPASQIVGFEGWSFAPHAFYALWKYAQVFGNAQSLFDLSKNNLENPPSDAVLEEMPHVHNAFIAGYLGYLELEKLAGYPESGDVRAELDRLMQLRVSTFSKDAPDAYFSDFQKFYCRSLNVSRNFMYLVPELGQYLHDNALSQIQDAIDEYETLAPHWFVSKVEATFGEGVITPLYDNNAIFQAKALILQEPFEQLAKYIDVPAVEVGDLFYIQNLVSTIEAAPNPISTGQAGSIQATHSQCDK